ncbi:CHASE2 domain-containing protein [Rhodospirillaceae bacterium SYSU D60014]|uniref:CHASE2 domain-containing protein n=1 Tax=Virgifigura deserti TaxID=2268457 RepID=UPI000E669D93
MRTVGWAHALIFLVVAALYLSGRLEFIEHRLVDARFQLAERAATGEVVVVLIDAASLKALGPWPWPRSYHARLLDALAAAGAGRVALDIDFSSRSTDEEDRELARAIAEVDGSVILPVFVQPGIDGQEPRLFFTEPLSDLRVNADLASVNVRPESDGLVRRMAVGAPWREDPIATLPVVLAGVPARIPDAFYVDYGIRPDTIPQISYVDVLEEHFDRALVAGKRVIVGAGAIELGDMTPAPLWLALPGPLVQALATESILQGRTLQRLPAWLVLAGTGFLLLATAPVFSRWPWRRSLVALIGINAIILVLPVPLQAYWPILPDTAPYLLACLLSFGAALVSRLDEQALRLLAQGFMLRRQDARMRRVVESTFDGLIVTDAAGIIRSFNPAAERIFVIPAKEAIGQPFARFVADTGSGHPETASGLPSLLGEAGLLREVLACRKDQQVFPIDLVITEMRCEDALSYLLTIRDISDRKEAERRAEEAQQQLLHAIRDLRKAKEQAELANKAKTEFLANMSHELRTPLNAVLGFAEIMKGELLGPIGTPAYLGYLEDIHDSAGHLLQIINDILDLAKIEAGKLDLQDEDIALSAAIDRAVTLVKERAAEGRVTIVADAPDHLPLLRADPRLFKQILSNLLSNAIKFTEPGGQVTIRAALATDGGLDISIIDTGIGIAEADLARVLKPFEQASTGLDRRYEGTGLGLPLVKFLVEAHGGAFALHSQVSVGTTATASFPPLRTKVVHDAREPQRPLSVVHAQTG